MSTYLIVDVTVHDPERFKEYARKSQPFVEKYARVYLVRGGEVEIQEGALTIETASQPKWTTLFRPQFKPSHPDQFVLKCQQLACGLPDYCHFV